MNKNLWLLTFCLFALSACSHVRDFEFPKLPEINMPDWSLFGKKEPAPVEQNLPLVQNLDSCPPVYLVPELAQIVQFQGQDLVAQTRITGLGRSCELTPTSTRVTIELEATGQLGKQGLKDAKIQANYTYPYLLAVINPRGQIVAKDVFALNAVYEHGQSARRFRDKIVQTIPHQREQNATGYQIQIGFQLSPAELAYNRANSR